MERLLSTQLVAWKSLKARKPILLDGARQVGKSYLIEQCFGAEHFKKVVKLDFLADPSLARIFAGSLNPDDILINIQVALETEIDPKEDLIFFDEIGECQRALDSLKYFAESRSDWYVCSSGSNIGLIDSFPVGKVHTLELFPMSFEEFLMASGKNILLKQYRERARQQVVHDKIWPLLLDYYFVGGMPEAVDAWFNNDISIVAKCQQISEIHSSLIAGYQRDFGKYSGKTNAQHIEAVFRNIPSQLSKHVDDSVKRFRFHGVIEKKKGYRDLYGPIEWLEKTKLISKCYPISAAPASPLAAYRKENIFKLFFFDVGLLGHMLNLTYAEFKAQSFSYKGYLAENFVQNEFRTIGYYPTYSWEAKSAEIEFLFKTPSGDIIPVEVKSGTRTQAKSLKSYVHQISPKKTVKLIGAAGGNRDEENIVWPLYYASKLQL